MSTAVPGPSSATPFAGLGGWPAVLGRITAGAELPAELAVGAFSEILQGEATAAQIAAFAVGMRTKGETVGELAAILGTMLAFSVEVPLPGDVRAAAVDTCGTGGDRSHSINVSTAAAFVVAGAGVPVCKHGGRAASSAAGSADVLEALGVAIELAPAGVARCVTEVGLGFCFAPRFHPAMRHAAPVRRELGVATLFNFLGPLANPGKVVRQVVGVSDPAMAPKVAGVLAARGVAHAMVVHGDDGLDELTTTTTSSVLEVRDGAVAARKVDPVALGLPRVEAGALRGGTAAENADALRRILSGAPGAHRDVVVLNAAAALVVAGRSEDLASAMAMAAAAIDDGRAAGVLDRLVGVSQEEQART